MSIEAEPVTIEPVLVVLRVTTSVDSSETKPSASESASSAMVTRLLATSAKVKLAASPRITELVPAATAALTVVAAFAPVSFRVIEPPARVRTASVTVTVPAPLVSKISYPVQLVVFVRL